ncbi:MAG: YihA family ribosome biogenesis GTP-binding protein [Sphingobacteriales bacterium]|jgi:GTP-binding protein|nr:YihA family ribosome biogenesis GTP-binding protein [Sphingobacteriales bacterium]MBP9140254.1 YihA family ribosome biogenesis GTP-binding protein [Chitinophagales bacterium]MDA0197612.1 ribosome biogenesis GTP-binding protein YihA/YsxC [Bacteroidota bacterium]MBK6889029.1 YihA family ribosome biogenesis GTP-binding protein [Sphingobacteriales bacterium]MBK7528467.1 YihA family ribosome biogenesis GTP-binding protein [Sphingobacteriales bacterium]
MLPPNTENNQNNEKKIQVVSAKLIGTYGHVQQMPPPILPEYAFIGRSNVGKSSLINMLTKRRDLAWVSHTPGKTQAINLFGIDDAWYLADLPGYGYAKVSKVARRQFSAMMTNYLKQRQNLQCVFHLIDSRIPPQTSDLDFCNWMGENGLPFVTVFTKIDDRKYQKGLHVNSFKTALAESWNELPESFLCSAVKNIGQSEILQFILKVNANFVPIALKE